jgi:hypothetical protein
MEYDMTLANAAFSLAGRWDVSRSTSDPSKLDFREGDIHGFNGNQIGNCLHLRLGAPLIPSQWYFWKDSNRMLPFPRPTFYIFPLYIISLCHQMQKFVFVFTKLRSSTLRRQRLNSLLLKLRNG